MISAARTPLAWLGALLAIYLIAPIAAFLVRLGHGAPGVPGLAGAVATSLETATISTAIIAVAGIPLAYLLARARGRLGAVLSVLVALPLALPPLMSGILLLYLVGPYTFLGRLFGGNLTDSRAGIVIAQTFVAAPFLVVAARAAFASIDPAYEEVAQTLGHGRLARFWRVALPLALPGVQAGLLLSWLRAFGEFGATVILAYHPYSLPVFTFVQFDATGLPSTMLAVAAALGAALVVLGAAAVHARRPRPRATLPAPRAPRPGPPEPLDFAVAKRLGSFELAIEHRASGPRLALLGPSGAGKSLTLRILAGITDAGRREIHGGPTAPAAGPGRGRIGYLPQHSALLPRQTVWQQATFAVDADPALAAWWLDRLGLNGLENRFPHELSGGQQRRVALARALARSPSLVLLDEPFSALDAPVRSRLYRDLRRLQREAGLSTVLVTHDPEEAALLADDIIVLDDGRALAQGPAAEVFARPRSTDVAALLGIPNTRAGTVLRAGWISSHGADLAAPTADLEPGTPVLWAVHPEAIRLDPAGPYAATVLDSVTLVVSHELTVALAELELTIRTRTDPGLPLDARCRVAIPAEAMTLWATEPAGTAPPDAPPDGSARYFEERHPQRRPDAAPRRPRTMKDRRRR